MVNYCVVPGCNSNRCKRGKNSVFSAPKDPVRREKWREIIKIQRLEPHHKVCSKHFKPKDIRWFSEYFDTAGNCIGRFSLRQPQLCENAMPFVGANDDNSRNPVEINDRYGSKDGENLVLAPHYKHYHDHSYTKHALQDVCIITQENLPMSNLSIEDSRSNEDDELPATSQLSTVVEVVNGQGAYNFPHYSGPTTERSYPNQEYVTGGPNTGLQVLHDSQYAVSKSFVNNVETIRKTIIEESIAESGFPSHNVISGQNIDLHIQDDSQYAVSESSVNNVETIRKTIIGESIAESGFPSHDVISGQNIELHIQDDSQYAVSESSVNNVETIRKTIIGESIAKSGFPSHDVISGQNIELHIQDDSQYAVSESSVNNVETIRKTIIEESIAESGFLSLCSNSSSASYLKDLPMNVTNVETSVTQSNDIEMDKILQSHSIQPDSQGRLSSVVHKDVNESNVIFEETFPLHTPKVVSPCLGNDDSTVDEAMDVFSPCQDPKHNEEPSRTVIDEGFEENFESSTDNIQSEAPPTGSTSQSDGYCGEERSSYPHSDTFAKFHDDLSKITFPNPWHIHSSLDKNPGFITVFETQDQDNDASRIIVRKSICIEKNLKVSYCVFGKKISAGKFKLQERIQDINEFQLAFDTFRNLGLCCGIGNLKDVALVQDRIGFNDALGVLRHNACELASSREQCKVCSKVTKTISQKKRRMARRNAPPKATNQSHFSDRDLMHKWKKKAILRGQSLRRKKKTIKSLRSRISDLRSKIEKVDINSLIKKCAKRKIPEVQVTLIQQIVAAAKCKSSKGMRYDEEWIMLCLLLHIQSPKQYRLIKRLNLMPLPSPQSIRRYLALIDFKCGFDKNFFEVFKKHMNGKSPRQKHGLLLIDEITLRESLSVNASSLSYQGLTDFGEDGRKASSIKEKAKTALVLMFQPLADTYTQPIAVFASNGPVKGIELAKIVASAVLQLERCGAQIHGIVCDGAETNRKMWREFGISGEFTSTKNWCQHPIHEDRKLFFFSDTPHLIKNVRNRIYKQDLKMDADRVPMKWQHFKTLYHTDVALSASKLGVCPKISDAHIYLTNSAKMRVPLATQLFSKSVAYGFHVYRSFPGLEDSHETESLCLRINDLFDALNRKHASQGVSPGSKDYIVLQESLAWLNDWEMSVINGRISKNEFLTDNTAEGLRVTIMSTLDIVDYLTQNYEFSYVLTGKINQDALEQFFGCSREACGSNEHPATPTFLMVYKLLSVFSVLKPPRYGNCSVIEETLPKRLITISDLREIYGSKKASKLEELKSKLDNLINHDEWEFSDVVEHDYSVAPIVDCVIYYVTGYLIRQIQKRTKCERCRNALVKPTDSNILAVEELVNLKSRGGLIHSNIQFFKMINRLEEIFSEYIEYADVYDRTVDKMLTTYSFTFPCQRHATDILAYSIKYYLCMRMRQFSQQENAKGRKPSAEKKKASRLCTK